MAGSAGSIYVDLLLRDGKYSDGLNRARRNTAAFGSGVSQNLGKAQAGFLSVLNPIQNVTAALSTLGLTLASALSVEKIVKYSDTWKQLSGRLGLVSGGLGDVAAKQSQLFAIAQETRQPLEDITNFYTRLNQFIPEAERNQYDLLGVTKSVASALAITGETAISAQAALIQFTQGIGTNFEAAGQELRSLQELAPRLTQALQNALGNGEMSLQQLVKAGKLTRESVLNALGGMGVEGRKLSEEMAKIPVTVAQAFTRLDNAFLKYIGTSGSVAEGTNSLAMAVSWLAENFQTLTDVVEIAAMVIGVGLVGKLAVAAAAFVAPTVAALSLDLAIAGLIAEVTGASTAFVALQAYAAAAATGLAAMAIPLAALAALAAGIYLLATNTDEAKVAEEKYAKAIGDSEKELRGFVKMSDEAKAEALKATDEKIQAARDEITAVSALYEAYIKMNLAQRAWYDVKSTFGLTSSTEEMAAVIGKANSAMDELIKRRERASAGEDPLGMSLNGGKSTAGRASDDEISKLKSMYSGYEATILGITDAELKFNKTREDARKLLDARMITEEAYARIISQAEDELIGAADSQKKLTDTYSKYESELTGLTSEQLEYNRAVAELTEYANASGMSNERLAEVLGRVKTKIEGTTKETETWAKRVEQISDQAARNMQDAFADFLFDPFKDGVGGMAENFAIALRKMAANLVSSKIFDLVGSYLSGGATNIAGAASTSGSSGGFLSSITSIFDGFFAEGGTIKPGHWGVAGEAGAELVYGGNTGATVIPQGGASGGGTVVNIINNTGANVSATSKNNGSGVDIEVMIDEAVAKNMSRSGSRTSQAMNAYSSRTLVRR